MLFLLIILVGAGYAGMVWLRHRPSPPAAAARPLKQPASVAAKPSPSDETKNQTAARYVANVGAAYQQMIKRQGEVAAVSDPLRRAKSQLAEKRYDLAMASAKEAWTALKGIPKTASSPGTDTYVVVRGDTLWRIARDHSPTHQGPGWVAIWKANKGTVKNFDRIEVGMNLKIPQKRSQYAMRYWKPRPQVAGIKPPRPAPGSSPSTLTQLLFDEPPARAAVTASLQVPSQPMLAQAHYP